MINFVCVACEVGVFMDKTMFIPFTVLTMKKYIVVVVE